MKKKKKRRRGGSIDDANEWNELLIGCKALNEDRLRKEIKGQQVMSAQYTCMP
jgi:hypothetical protein